MAFSGLWCAAIWALGLASWCHCAAALGNQELSIPRGLPWDLPSPIAPLVGPGFAAPECKIVGIGGLPARGLLRLNHLREYPRARNKPRRLPWCRSEG